jgi:hypothetical protein
MNNCESFPDIWTDPNKGKKTEDERRAIQEENDRRERLYRALRYVLMQSFRLERDFPAEPKDFGTSESISQANRILFASIYGLLLADNWTDPSLGRTERMEGEEVIHYSRKNEAGETEARAPIVIANKFADAVVEAVQEYNRNHDLFVEVFNLMARKADVEEAEGKSKPSSKGQTPVAKSP